MERELVPRKDLNMPTSTTHQRLRRALEDVDFPAEKDRLVDQALENDADDHGACAHARYAM